MNNCEKTTVAAFRDTLEITGSDFVYTAPAQDDSAQIRFIGNFAGRPVIWEATIIALEHRQATDRPGESPDSSKQFIEVEDTSDDVRHIRIGLQLHSIDEQLISKTIIMIRKYKRLQTGRHVFSYRSLLR